MSPKTATTLAILGLLLSFAAPVSGREKTEAPPARVEKTTPAEPTQERAVVVPWEGSAVPMSRDPMPMTVGPLVIGAFHLFPAQEPGPHIGPPGRIWGLGFGTSLWRDPITRWPLM